MCLRVRVYVCACKLRYDLGYKLVERDGRSGRSRGVYGLKGSFFGRWGYRMIEGYFIGGFVICKNT